jgi:hypothetical protein
MSARRRCGVPGQEMGTADYARCARVTLVSSHR